MSRPPLGDARTVVHGRSDEWVGELNSQAVITDQACDFSWLQVREDKCRSPVGLPNLINRS